MVCCEKVKSEKSLLMDELESAVRVILEFQYFFSSVCQNECKNPLLPKTSSSVGEKKLNINNSV